MPDSLTSPAGTAKVIAVDAGSTKTDVALVDSRGGVLATARGAGMLAAEPMPLWVARIEQLIAGMLGEAERVVLSACMAHLDLPEEEEEFASLLRSRPWVGEAMVRNDTLAVLRAGGPGTGVAVVCGTGINCVGVGPDGRQARFLAFGDTSGDWGGGNDLGMAALWHAIRAEDGRGEPTALVAALLDHLGLNSMREVALRLRGERLTSMDVRHCTPVLLAVAAQGDPVATALVRRQAAEICAMVRVAMDRIGVADHGTVVVLGGSVLAARHPLLLSAVRDGIATFSPASSVVVTDVPPLAGAALLGLDHMGAGAEAERALRAALAGRIHTGAG
ncbi:ATPase [Dactylosporangium roseum]|uniref:ATPase n=1 Tax=Dactylosporangium roseum TaxID=47989 RepID=A0ABY5ZEF5_9ACTN|nr:BadF/BadG/BcrA/BcrD ATPase family protein [Dactylosporangium roseum]UWZ39328.1 ATPase [Dactylosporangium roseum]